MKAVKFFLFLDTFPNFASLAWPFTVLQNDNITISWDFLRLTAPVALLGHLGAVSLKKSHDIVVLSFCKI